MEVLRFTDDPNILSESHNYARSLRAIGQDLTECNPEELEIRVSGAEFSATGVGLLQSAPEEKEGGNAIGRAWNRLTSKEPKPGGCADSRQRQRFTREYTPDVINRLDELGRPKRANKEGKPDIYSLGERLRTVGRIVDSCHGTLIRIVKDNNSMKFEYRDSDGIDHKAEFTNLALYKYQQRFYAERGTYIEIDPWDTQN